MLKNSSFISEGIVGPFKLSAKHSHAKNMGEAQDFHEHLLDVSLTFRSLHESGITLLLDKETERILIAKLKQFFDQKFDKTSIETMGKELFIDVEDTLPDLKKRLKDTYGNLYDFQLQKTSITVYYDGSLDHPNTPMTFTTELK